MATDHRSKAVYTVKDASEQFSRTPGRIRQICIAHSIGELIENRIRLLNAKDMQKICKIIEEEGYKTS